jgi:hypothetical protein
MSDSESSSFTIRLTADDQRMLAALCTHYGLNRPDSLRRAMRQVLCRRPTLDTGYFVPAHHRSSVFSIQLAREAAHE